MSKLVIRSINEQVSRWLHAYIATGFSVAVLFSLLMGWSAGYSAMMGCLAWLIPQWMFARRLFANVRPRAAQDIVRTFYLWEFLKIISSAALCIAAVKTLKVAVAPFFIGYLVTQQGIWLTPWLTSKRRALS